MRPPGRTLSRYPCGCNARQPPPAARKCAHAGIQRRKAATQASRAGQASWLPTGPPSAPPPLPPAELLAPDAAYTVFIPLLNATTAAQAQAFPQLSPNLVLPDVYWNVSFAAGAARRRPKDLARAAVALPQQPGTRLVCCTPRAAHQHGPRTHGRQPSHPPILCRPAC